MESWVGGVLIMEGVDVISALTRFSRVVDFSIPLNVPLFVMSFGYEVAYLHCCFWCLPAAVHLVE